MCPCMCACVSACLRMHRTCVRMRASRGVGVLQFSVFAQKVNVLPWELLEKEKELVAVLRGIQEATDPDGEAPALLERHFPELHQEQTWKQFCDGRFHGVQLLPPVADDATDGRRYTGEEMLAVVVDETNDLAQCLLHFAILRMQTGTSPPRQRDDYQFEDVDGRNARKLTEAMGKCLDLRQLCQGSLDLVAANQALEYIHGAAVRSGAWMPALEVLQRQLEDLMVRLTDAATTEIYRDRWFKDEQGGAGAVVQPGTVVMRDLFTHSTLYQGLESILYVFERCAVKGRNEAVVEGMTSVLARHTDTKRCLSPEAATAEAYIHWNGPPLHAADAIISAALDAYFGEGNSWHFAHTSYGGLHGLFSGTSQVLQRIRAEQPGRLSFLTK
eukprot:GHVU01038609.1.p1 GENE.GHVU01038609.1~~GHVU01038609.1.p1  ORF type:complete len:386 (+),score=44.12 GHVU01038609.1:1559-2716(+)